MVADLKKETVGKVKGGGTSKVCLPASKVRSMSQAERDKVVNAKRSAASRGKYKRSSSSNVKGALIYLQYFHDSIFLLDHTLVYLFL